MRWLECLADAHVLVPVLDAEGDARLHESLAQNCSPPVDRIDPVTSIRPLPRAESAALHPWPQSYDPLHSAVLSTLAAAVPIVVLLGCIASRRVKAHHAALIAQTSCTSALQFTSKSVAPAVLVLLSQCTG